MVRPIVLIPKSDAWIYRNPKVIGRIRQGLKDAAQGKLEKVENLKIFLKNL